MGNKRVLAKRPVRTNLLVSVVAITIFALAIVVSPRAFAETNPSTNVLKVSPVRTDVQITPGASKVVQVNVTNLTPTDVLVHPIENDFTAGDERGTPALILAEDQYAPSHSLKRFMTPLQDVMIPASSTKTIDVIITVPQDAQAGGYFGAIRFAPATGENGGQVNLNASVASLVLLTVPGDTVEQLKLTEYVIQQKGKTGTYFSTPDNLQVSFRFENKGNVQEALFGKLSIKKGNTVVYEDDFNVDEPRDVILPDTARRWDVPLRSIEAFGHYTVSATLTYGADNQSVEVSKSFWVIPTWLIIAAIAAVVVLIGLIVIIILAVVRSRKRRHMPRGYNRGYRR